MPYTKTTWNAGAAPGISAVLLNNLETQYEQALLDSVNSTGDTMTGDLNMSTNAKIVHNATIGTKQIYYPPGYQRGIASATLWDSTDKYYVLYSSGDTPGVSTPTIRIDAIQKTYEMWTNLFFPANYSIIMENGTANALSFRADGSHNFVITNTIGLAMYRPPGQENSVINLEAEYGTQGARIQASNGRLQLYASNPARSASSAPIELLWDQCFIQGKITAMVGQISAPDAHTFRGYNFNVAAFDRLGTEGSILAFAVNGSYKGAISISGDTVLYQAFAGSHGTRLKPGQERPPKYGVVVASGETFQIEESKPSPYISSTTMKTDPNVYGIWTDLQSGEAEYNNLAEQVASLGLYLARVCDEDGDIANGSLLCTSTHPYEATKQLADIVRASTLGKALEAVTWADVEIDTTLGYKWKVIPVTLCCG